MEPLPDLSNFWIRDALNSKTEESSPGVMQILSKEDRKEKGRCILEIFDGVQQYDYALSLIGPMLTIHEFSVIEVLSYKKIDHK